VFQSRAFPQSYQRVKCPPQTRKDNTRIAGGARKSCVVLTFFAAYNLFVFLRLPEMKFMNIIFCSLPGNGATSMLFGVEVSVLQSQNRASSITPEVWLCGFPQSRMTEFFVGAILSTGCSSAVLSFPSKGDCKKRELHGGKES
jgi:hypothetical protein